MMPPTIHPSRLSLSSFIVFLFPTKKARYCAPYVRLDPLFQFDSFPAKPSLSQALYAPPKLGIPIIHVFNPLCILFIRTWICYSICRASPHSPHFVPALATLHGRSRTTKLCGSVGSRTSLPVRCWPRLNVGEQKLQ